MTPEPNEWHDVAIAKLVRVMGEAAGRSIAQSVLEEIGLTRLRSAEDMHRFAAALLSRSGFASAVAALLELHATMYESPAVNER